MLIDDYIFYTNEYKKKYGEKTLVLMQVGNFYEIYSIKDDTDADIYKIADICNITISRKNKKINEVNKSNALMAGFPLYVIAKFQNILLQHNYTLVMIQQVTESSNVEKVERKVTEILSPGMNTNLNTKKSNYMMIIYYEKINNLYIVGTSLIDVSTGKCFISEIASSKDDKDFANNEIVRIIISYNPCEIVFISNESIDDNDIKKIKEIIHLNNNILVHYLWNSYEYIDVMGDLDVCNGHFGPTPDFPQGIYHYHSTIENGIGEMGFPYFLICYHGEVPDTGNNGGGGDDPCSGYGETWGPGIGPPPAGCGGGGGQGTQSTDTVMLTNTLDWSSILLGLILLTMGINAFRRYRR